MISEVNASLYNRSDKSKLNIILNVMIAVILIVIVFEIAFGMTYSGIYVVQSSMRPTLIGAEEENLPGGDYVYVNKNAKPTYGDIVVVFKDSRTTIIKRVIALGGDRVKIIDGVLYIKYAGEDEFKLIEEDYVSPSNNTGKPGSQPTNFPKIEGTVSEDGYYVKNGYVFLLGDNRDVSNDSRAEGSYPLTDLFGVVTDWSLKNKNFFTALHKYFSFDLPKCFGINK